MTDYVKSTSFASKDSLPLGDPLKIVKGTEIDIEFNNIATAVTTKADINSPALVGAPTAPTPAFGNNTTLLATTAFVQAALQAVYPIGSIYVNAGVTTNPSTLLGFGTWVAFGAGRVMVGLNGSDALFDSLEETGGNKDSSVVAHTHTGTTASDGAHTHFTIRDQGTDNTSQYSINVTSSNYVAGTGGGGYELYTLNSQSNVANAGLTSSGGVHAHTITTDSTGSTGTNTNLQPYITVAMWKRTA